MKRVQIALFVGFTCLLSACATIRQRSSITSLDQIYRIEPQQTLYAIDATGRVRPKQLTKRATAALYEREDTLYAEFLAETLPMPDGDPKTLDQSDSLKQLFYHYNRRLDHVEEKSPWFRYQLTSFDVDLFTVPFKYRFGQVGNPGELSTSANIGVYFGARYDLGRYRNVYYRRNRRSDIRSFSFGLGGVMSINPVTVNAFNTDGRLPTDEYEALGINGGLALIVGYKSLTAGLALGVENLTDRNNSIWIYRNKPWLGLTVGVNLN